MAKAVPVAQVVHAQPVPVQPAAPKQESFWTRMLNAKVGGGGGGGIVLLVVIWFLLSSGSKKPVQEMTAEELRAEKQRLAGEMKTWMQAHPPRLGQPPLETLANNASIRKTITRLRAVCAQLGEPVSDLDKLLRMLDEHDDLAHRQLRGEQ